MSAALDKIFRPLEEPERKLLERLLDHHPFEGRDELRKQLDSTTARLIVEHNDNYGSIELLVADPTPANVLCAIPVEAEYRDEDGIPVWVLLHVRKGVMWQLEICWLTGVPSSGLPHLSGSSHSRRTTPHSSKERRQRQEPPGRKRSG